MAQWKETPTQGTQMQPLVGELRPRMPRGSQACALQPTPSPQKMMDIAADASLTWVINACSMQETVMDLLGYPHFIPSAQGCLYPQVSLQNVPADVVEDGYYVEMERWSCRPVL